MSGELDMTAITSDRRAMTGTSALHGHQLEGNMARAAAAEGVGTFVLVLSIVSTVIAAALAQPVAGSPYSSVAVPLAGGIALAVLVASLGHVSGPTSIQRSRWDWPSTAASRQPLWQATCWLSLPAR